MRGLVLQVLGDALGNVGVILSGLVIWHTRWSFKHYFDPISSLVTTVIIFSNALSLGVPPAISLDVVRDSIMKVDGVLSVHELHVWQLSEPKVIASAHVLISQNRDFMPIAVKIREALHDHGIHSSTIQPESRGLGTDDLQEQGQGKEPDFCSLDKLSSVVALEDDAVDAVLDGTSDEGYASRIPGPIDRVLGKALITSGPGLCRS
ncbi:hypothetical protein C0993_007555 [Termitomyces sp. T159_Od127]|nr:hypothetical protein C0993_007555 [Termitomyces sp. T159_Od127]